MRLGKGQIKNCVFICNCSHLSLPLHPHKVAQMVESVDTRDLKSLGHIGCTGSSPVPGTKTD